MTTDYQGYPAGLERALLFLTDSTGAAIGSASPLANGSGSGAIVLANPVSSNLAPIAINNLQIKGGDAVRFIVQFGNQKLNAFQLALSDYQTQLIRTISGSLMNQQNTKATLISDNPMNPIPLIMGVALQQRLLLPNNQGQYYITRIMPNCQVRIHPGSMNFQAESDSILDITPNPTNTDVTGASFAPAALNMNLYGNDTDYYDYISLGGKPPHIYSFREDGTATTFTTPFQPTNTVITLNATTNSFFINGTATALASITTAGVATLSAAGTAGNIGVLIYETNYFPTS